MLRSAFPEALRLMSVEPGRSQPDLQATPPMGYALLDMLRRAEESGEAPAVEAHLPGSEQAHLNLVQPVSIAEQVLGSLVLSYPPSALRAALPGDGSGSLLLEHRGGARVLALGNAGEAQAFVAPVPGTPWQLRYWPADLKGAGATATVAGVLLVALVLLLIGSLGIVALLGRRLRADSGRLAEIVEDLQAGQLKLEYPVGLGLFRPAIARGVRAARAVEERLDSGAPGPDGGPFAQASPRAVTEALDDMGGLVVETVDMEPETISKSREGNMNEVLKAPVAGNGVLDPAILRAYDIRGIVGPALNAGVMRLLGQAIGSEAAALGQQEIVVGRDGRLSSEELAAALIEGLRAAGRDVIDVGQVPTPVTYFACHHLGTQAGVMVTGSHNPKDYNGLKIMLGGETLSGEAIQALGRRVEQGDFISGEGGLRSQEVVADYIDRIAGDITLHRPLKVVLDCGNGVAGAIGPQLLRTLGCEVEELFCEVDGHFPNHHPDPTVPENLEALASLVRLQGADLGLAYDGDADRIGVVDATGKIIWPDRQMMLYARDILGRQPGAEIVYDIKCSAQLEQLIREEGGKPLMWKTGHSLIKGKLKETGAPLAGEMSGHIFFQERWYGFDDAMYSSARLLEILSRDPRSSTEVFAELPEALGTPELRVDLDEGEPPRLMAELEQRLAEEFREARISTIDGIRADFDDGWGLVRASNTTPCLVLRFEADDQAALERIQAAFRKHLQAVKPGIDLPF
ncbi:phosphomannomutase/phosphoglucomutase [Alkalilimnicola sp. S0819]|nr:phosphomannomutase/phosphoglucomutase [Alkalilimnicola sp. S0819]MPQ16094.1 phosphomannomutase/phosphoglucomutase [Alkalilimnicola sp. S0819]